MVISINCDINNGNGQLYDKCHEMSYNDKYDFKTIGPRQIFLTF